MLPKQKDKQCRKSHTFIAVTPPSVAKKAGKKIEVTQKIDR